LVSKFRPAGIVPSGSGKHPNRDAGTTARERMKRKKEVSSMKKLGFATIVASGLAAAVLGLAAPADAAPSGPGNAQDTISKLEAQGYNVIINHVGSTPLEQASVVSVRPGQTFSRTDSGTPGDDLMTTVLDKTVYVDVK
jgi:hypothetical protein